MSKYFSPLVLVCLREAHMLFLKPESIRGKWTVLLFRINFRNSHSSVIFELEFNLTKGMIENHYLFFKNSVSSLI